MGKRYYCDYCDRSFVDDVEARKKHINGTVHIRLRKEHYDQFKDAKTILSEETAKAPCQRYQRHGECVFGNSCRYSHYTAQQILDLRLQIEEQERLEELQRTDELEDDGAGPSLTSWLQKRSQVKLLGQTNSLLSWKLPSSLQGRSELPLSVRPVRIVDFKSSDFETWG